jgi:putative membrane protein
LAGIYFGILKENQVMKNPSNLYWSLALAFLLLSCGNGGSDSVKNAKEANAEKIDSQKATERPVDSTAVVTSKSDADFLVNAASGGMVEVQLGRLAQTNSRNVRIQAFGGMMIKDHGANGEQLKALATAKNVTLPVTVSNRQQKEIEHLQKKKGKDFDKAYIRLMVGDHKDDIREFEKQTGKAVNPGIAAFASSSLDMLHRHLDSAESLRKMLGLDSITVTTPIPPVVP